MVAISSMSNPSHLQGPVQGHESSHIEVEPFCFVV